MAELPIYLIKLKARDAKVTNYLAVEIPIGRSIKNWKILGQTTKGLIDSQAIYQGTGEIVSERQTNLHKDGKYYSTLTFPGALGTLKYEEAGSLDDTYIKDGDYHPSRLAIFIGEGNIVNGKFVTSKRIRER